MADLTWTEQQKILLITSSNPDRHIKAIFDSQIAITCDNHYQCNTWLQQIVILTYYS